MRITFVLPHADLSGGVRVIAIYAQGLIRRGHQVSVVSTPRSQPPFRRKVKSFLKGKGWIKKLPDGPSHLDGLDIDWRVIEKVRPITDADVPDADVVIAGWWETVEWVMGLRRKKGAKVHLIQGDERIYFPPGSEYWKRAENTWRMPTHKIAISRWLHDLVKSVNGNRQCALVPNTVDTGQFHSERRGPQTAPTVGMAYSPAWFKGTDVALKAFRLAAQKIPGLRLESFGQYPLTEELPLPPGSGYEYQPAQDRIRDLYGRCDVWLCASRVEGFGLPILEAMACRCVVVTTRFGCTEDVVVDGVTGFLVEVDDSQALADRIIKFFSLPAERRMEMAEAALASVKKYTWEDAIGHFEEELYTAGEGAGVHA